MDVGHVFHCMFDHLSLPGPVVLTIERCFTRMVPVQAQQPESKPAPAPAAAERTSPTRGGGNPRTRSPGRTRKPTNGGGEPEVAKMRELVASERVLSLNLDCSEILEGVVRWPLPHPLAAWLRVAYPGPQQTLTRCACARNALDGNHPERHHVHAKHRCFPTSGARAVGGRTREQGRVACGRGADKLRRRRVLGPAGHVLPEINAWSSQPAHRGVVDGSFSTS
jgi:hypothetical protein